MARGSKAVVSARGQIPLKGPDQIALMRRAGQIVAATLAKLEAMVAPGVTTGELDRLAGSMVKALGGKPSFPEKRFPGTICASVNDEVVHGIPGERVLRPGDLISIDLGAIFDGYHGDAAVTVPVGETSAEARELIAVTRAALGKAIEQARPGKRLSALSLAVQRHVESHGYAVVRDLTGHGIGRTMHEPPQVPNFAEGPSGPILRAGMTLAIEPMVNAGSWEIEQSPDGWTFRTRDGSLSAHFEHTVWISEQGPVILTEPDPRLSKGDRPSA